MNEWISVKHNVFPDDYRDVLVCLGNGHIDIARHVLPYVGIGSNYEGVGRWFYPDDPDGEYLIRDNQKDRFRVVAWMELPNPYIEPQDKEQKA